jgi:DNA topoisomerase-1
MPKRLVIVESPAKARTIAGYLGSDYAVESSVGHIRDLPDRASDVPEAQRKRFGALGVDVAQGFEPYYIVDPGKKKIVTELRKRLSEADELLLATDEDREGEAIAWHLVEVLKPKVPVRRMVFHEITKEAIARALEETRSIDKRLVDAQETRRILDRLYGYEVSPVLWKKVTRGLSAGRVQSVATRLVVERERERMAFTSAEYWDLVATFDPGSFEARLIALDGSRVAQGRDFATSGALRDDSVTRLDEEGARSLASRLEGAAFQVRSVEERPYRRKPAAPFRTATLQQEASRKLRFSAQTTMPSVIIVGQPSAQPAPSSERALTKQEVIDLYAGKSWFWSDGIGYFAPKGQFRNKSFRPLRQIHYTRVFAIFVSQILRKEI